MTDKGIDLSNYDSIDASTVACFIANGYTHALIGCQVESIGHQQFATCTNGGMVVNTTYCFLYFGFDGFMGFQDLIALETNKAIRVALAHGATHVALDCEADGINARGGITAAERIADWQRARDMVISAGLLPILYTGWYYWQSHMADAQFDDPLWLANYGQANGMQPPPPPITTIVMGGRPHEVNIHQYASLPDLCGRESRDRNYIVKPWWDEMTEDQIRAIVRDELSRGLRQDDPQTPALVGPSSVPSLVAQIVGPDNPTYSDQENLATIVRVRDHLASLSSDQQPDPGTHNHTPAQIQHTHGEAR